jgi:hypothetical protein
LTPAGAAAAQDAHDEWQRERDPAVAVFAKWFGREWAERVAREARSIPSHWFPYDRVRVVNADP